MLLNATILVVEDSQTQAIQLQALLEQHGCKVQRASDGEQGLQRVKQQVPDLIISDVVMPTMDGYTLCHQLKNDPATQHIPILLVTTLTDPADVLKGLMCGADNFITKPYEERYLLSRINYLLANFALHEQRRSSLKMQLVLNGKLHVINAAQQQILDLLISTYEEGVRLNQDLAAKHQELQQSYRLLRGLFDFTNQLSESGSESQVLRTALEQVRSLPEVMGAWLYAADEESKMQLAGQGGTLPSAIVLQRCYDAGCSCQQLQQSASPLAVDIDGCQALLDDFEQQHHACVPVRLGDNTIGLLNVVRAGGAAWSAADLEPLKAFSQQLAVAWGRASMLQQLQAKLEQQANFDELTALPNRSLLQDRIQQAIVQAQHKKHGFTLALIDLDNFKNINESVGHQVGDQLLLQVAERLKQSISDVDTVSRLGGDEFVLVLAEQHGTTAVSGVLREILTLLNQPYQLEEMTPIVTASIGYCFYPEDGTDATTLLKHLDTAMYQAKNNGRNQLHGYSSDLSDVLAERMKLEQQLRLGIEQDELELHYQPQLDLHSGKLKGFEALVRWRHKDELRSPLSFIPLAEECGLISRIDAWVLQQACQQLVSWQQSDWPDATMSVNVSAGSIEDGSCIDLVKQTLASTGLVAHFLKLEVTESVLMRKPDDAARTMKALRKMGVELSIDDFGTGYSSLTYIKRFPFSELKIDKLFVDGVVHNAEDNALVRAIVKLGQTLNMKVVAEGVESESQQTILSRSGCDMIQGYHYAKPMPAALCDDFLATLARKRVSAYAALDEVSPRTLLILDDDENLLKALNRQLRHEGYRILTASNAEQALELLSLHQVQVVLAEHQLQVSDTMNGLDFLRQIKLIHSDTVRIVLSGNTELKAVFKAVNDGAVFRFLTKPWDKEHLNQVLKQAFHESDLLAENHAMRAQLERLQAEGKGAPSR
ncbi:EAL domain-containing protein [Alkalimonas amylolytica]|uniref:Diguanylate cyclase (GGDEF) domain-containing protein n=1 Tax=Alkalimonas amylolytica TaxID=152573 RepID=A0A1H3ZHQ8_ALKAM|nr:EAL domain-containing protein [Alkalimonas amylolytica]SEA23276.1 diguanylate cyclase (GGDEF) domain-containing protein [Alkalimonas amylolytica]